MKLCRFLTQDQIRIFMLEVTSDVIPVVFSSVR